MKYVKKYSLFERTDIEQSKQLIKVAEEIINLFYEEWDQYIEHANENEFTRVLFNPFSIDYRNIFFVYITGESDKRGSFSKNDSGGAKYVIKISAPDVYKKLKHVEKLIEQEGKNEQQIKDAEKIINNLKNDKDVYSEFMYVLTHELSHYKDKLKYDIFSGKKQNKLREIKNTLNNIQTDSNLKDELTYTKKKLYYNLNTEYNAYFLGFCAEELETMNQHYETSNEKWFEYDNFPSYYKYFYNTVISDKPYSNKNIKNLQKRLYQFYMDLKKLDDEIFKSKN